MHPDELANWTRIKEVFEENGTTENYFYRRACAIVRGEPDPMSNLPNVSQDGWNQTWALHHWKAVPGDDWQSNWQTQQNRYSYKRDPWWNPSGILLSWSPVISRSRLNLKIYKEEPLRGTYENSQHLCSKLYYCNYRLPLQLSLIHISEPTRPY